MRMLAQRGDDGAPRVLSLCLASPFGSLDDLTSTAQDRIVDFDEIAPQEESTAGSPRALQRRVQAVEPARRVVLGGAARASAAPRCGRTRGGARVHAVLLRAHA